MKSIFTLTLNPAIDKSSTVDHVLPENKLRCSNPVHEPGGGGINVSRAIKKLGGESVAVYPKGGPTGELLHHLLKKEGINQHPIPSKNWNRENFIVLETATNRQFRFGMPGAELMESEWKQCLDDINKQGDHIDYLVVSGSNPPGVPKEFYSEIARIAKQKDAKLIIDTSGEALEEALEEGVFLVKPNIKELSDLIGRELTTVPDKEEAALELINKRKIEMLVVSLGAAGAMLASKDGVFHVAAPSVSSKSTVGAGDSMVAGIVLSLSRGLNPADALRYGVACGTAATMNSGTELCKLEDVEKLYKWIKENAKKSNANFLTAR